VSSPSEPLTEQAITDGNISDDETKGNHETGSVSSGDDEASQRVFELESWAEALEEDNRSMELALVSLETDMLELESHRDYLEDVIKRALSQLSKTTPGEKGEKRIEFAQLITFSPIKNDHSSHSPSSSLSTEMSSRPTSGGQEIQTMEQSKMVSIAINKWLGDSAYR